LYEKLKQSIQGSGFSSVNEFVVYVLRDLASSLHDDRNDLSQQEIDAIKRRLKNLGYI
jgi:hypothetical protein